MSGPGSVGSIKFYSYDGPIDLSDFKIDYNTPDNCGLLSEKEAEAILADMPAQSWLLRKDSNGNPVATAKKVDGSFEHKACGEKAGDRLPSNPEGFKISPRRFGALSREQAETLLNDKEPGTWLFRFSININSYVISKKVGGEIHHASHTNFSSFLVDGPFDSAISTHGQDRMLSNPKFLKTKQV